MRNIFLLVLSVFLTSVSYADETQLNASSRLSSEQITAINTGEVRFTCGISCAFSWGANSASMKRLHDAEIWDELIYLVMYVGAERAESYYYLARSLEGKGNFEAAQKYYKLGLASKKYPSDKFSYPDDINNSLVRIENVKNQNNLNTISKLKTEINLPQGWSQRPLTTSLKDAGIEFYAFSNTIGAGVRYWTFDKSAVVNVHSFVRNTKDNMLKSLIDVESGEIAELLINGNKAYRFEVIGTPKNTSAVITYLVTFVEGKNYLVRSDVFIERKNYADYKDYLEKIAFGLKSSDLNNSDASIYISSSSSLNVKPIEIVKQNQSEEDPKRNPLIIASRRALVIGNDTYKTIPKLLAAREDARTIASSLSAVGYQVTLKLDLNEKEMKSALRTFAAQVQGGDEVMFFFAGHGVQLGATNYLLPTDIVGDSEAQVRDEAIQLQRVLDDMSEKKAKFTLAMIDACRDNPFKTAGRAIGGRGLAPTTAATGQMVIFSAGTGQQALDRLGNSDRNKNGLFTRVFVQEMQKPDVSIDRVVKNVRNQVAELAKSVGHEQVPAIYDQVLGDFYFKK